MRKLATGNARHLLMRAGLSFVLGWFGVQELHSPSEWAVFVPTFVSDLSPIAVDDLILLHGFLLLLAAAMVLLGLFLAPGCLLALGLLSEIVLGLTLDGGISDLVIRDIGLLALAAALGLDQTRTWHLETIVARWLATSPNRTKSPAHDVPAAPWLPRAGYASALLIAVLAIAFLLRITGSDSLTAPGTSVASLTSQNSQPIPPTGVPAAGATATPTPAATTRFDDWRYKQYAFQVYPGDINDDARKALSGFDLSIQDNSDSVTVFLKALSPRYNDAQFSVRKGDTAYFIETSMRDDPSGLENNLRDDGLIAVNPQGYIESS